MLKTIVIRDAAAPAMKPQPGLVRVDVDTPLKEPIANTLLRDVPGVAESAWFDSEVALLAVHGAKNLSDVIAAGARLLVTREHVVFPEQGGPVPEGGVKMISFFRRKDGMAFKEFDDYWRDRHGPIVRRTPHLRRYVQSHLIAEHYQGKTPPFCDGVTELWFDSLDDFRAGWASPAMQQEQFQDSAKFIAEGIFHSVVTTRRVI